MKNFLLTSMLLFTTIVAKAQMSYQVSLLNTATGEPRANVTVNATATITNSQNETIYTSTQRATSNDFGVLQLIVGNADTFKGLDTGKLPLFIEVSVDGTKIGKTQIMTVPMAEVATTLKSSFTKDDLVRKEWVYRWNGDREWGEVKYAFDVNNKFSVTNKYYDGMYGGTEGIETGTYEIEGNFIHCYGKSDENGNLTYDLLRWYNGVLVELYGDEFR